MFAEYLSADHPEVRSLTQLDRAHTSKRSSPATASRPWRGRVARDQPVSRCVEHSGPSSTVRCFFDDLALWGWAQRRPRRLLFASRHPPAGHAAAPRACLRTADRDLMAAVAELADPFARTALTILRGTGIRLGELPRPRARLRLSTPPATAAG